MAELLDTLLLSYVDEIIMVDKITLSHIRIYVNESHDTFEFQQLESQLQESVLQ